MVAVVLLLGTPCAFSQMDEPKPELGEVDSYAGVGFGGVGTHAAFGASSGIGMSKYAIGLIDTSFMPLGSSTLTHNPNKTVRSQLWDFNFAIHVQIPLKHSWTPYILLGSAFLYNTYHTETFLPNGVIIRAGYNDPKFGFETGGGVRYFIHEDWGVRGEYRYTISTNNFSRIFAGVFYQFSGPWPFLPRGRRSPVYGPAIIPKN
jgi:opacity protein-like surface antigen